MADNKNLNQGMKEGGFDTGKQGIHESPGKNPQTDKQAGKQGGLNKRDDLHKGIDQRGRQGGSYKPADQKEQIRR